MRKQKVNIYTDKYGQKYLKIGRRKIYIDNKLSERDLIKFLVTYLKPKRKKAKAKEKEPKQQQRNIIIPSQADSRMFDLSNQLEEKIREVNAEKQKRLMIEDKQPIDDKMMIEDKQSDNDVKALPKPKFQIRLFGKNYEIDDENLYQALLMQGAEFDEQTKAEENKRLEIEQKTKQEQEMRAKYESINKFTVEQLRGYMREYLENNVVTFNEKELKVSDLKTKGGPTKKELVNLFLQYDILKNNAPKQKEESSVKKLINQFEQQGEGFSGTGLYNTEIDKIMNKFSKYYLGTISRDQINDILPKIKQHSKGAFIMNTDESYKDGEHWVAVWFDATKEGSHSIEYYDSFAEALPLDIVDGLMKIGKKLQDDSLALKSNQVKDQSVTSNMCGWYCINFLIDRIHGVSFEKASEFNNNVFPNILKNEKQIEKFKKKYKLKEVEQNGKGFMDFIKKIPNRLKSILDFKPRDKASGRVNDFLEKEGDKKIKSISVGRTPVPSGIQSVLNLLSFGKFDKKKKEMDYDDIYHQYMVINYEDGTKKKLEKNASVEVSDVNEKDLKNLKVDIPLSRDLNTKQLINNASLNDDTFYKYDPAKNNCQIFVRNIVDRNDLLPNVDSTQFLQTQDSQKLMESLPGPLRNIPLVITNLASASDKVIYGDGKKNDDDYVKARLIIDGII